MTLLKGHQFILEGSGYQNSPNLGPEHRFWSRAIDMMLSKRTQPSELQCVHLLNGDNNTYLVRFPLGLNEIMQTHCLDTVLL